MVSTRRRKSSDRRVATDSRPNMGRRGKLSSSKKSSDPLDELGLDEIDEHYAKRNAQLDGFDSDDSLSIDLESESDEEVLGKTGRRGKNEAASDASDSDAGSDSDSESFDSDEEMEKNTRYGQLLKQAKAIKAKLDIERGEDSGSDEEFSAGSDELDGSAPDADIDTDALGWGSKKRSYYDADNVDMEGSESEEDLEAEARRLQRETMGNLTEEDFRGVMDDDNGHDGHDGHDDDDELDAVSSDEEFADMRASAIRQDALELKALLGELRTSLSEIRSRLAPLLAELRAGKLGTQQGVSYLEAKHVLLMHYVANLVFYLLLKAEGKPVKEHPVIGRLIEIRGYLEKARVIDKKLKYQIEKLLMAAEGESLSQGRKGEATATAAADVAGEEMAVAKPRPGALVVDDDDEDDDDDEFGTERKTMGRDDNGAYRPPRLNPVSMELEDEAPDDAKLSGKERRKQINASRKASRSQYIQEFAAELAGAPEEKKMGVPIGMDTADALRHRQKLAARAEVEEELMIRVPLSKDERKKLKAQRRAGLSGKALLDDFQDDLADLVGGAGNADDLGVDARFSKHKTNQLYGADLSLQNSKKRGFSGDADIPERASLAARRANMDGIRAKQQGRAISYDFKEKNYPSGRSTDVGTETDFYRSAKKMSESRKKQKRDANAPDALLPPMAEATGTGARKIDTAIEKNRGLTPHRRKDLKNPRKKHRIKFAEAKVRRSGAVQKVKEGAAGGYEGEMTGIKSRVSKSVRF